MRKAKQVVAMLLAVAMSISLLSTEALAARDNSKQSVTDEVMQSRTEIMSSDGQIVKALDDCERVYGNPYIIYKGDGKQYLTN